MATMTRGGVAPLTREGRRKGSSLPTGGRKVGSSLLPAKRTSPPKK